MGKALSGELSCPVTGLICKYCKIILQYCACDVTAWLSDKTESSCLEVESGMKIVYFSSPGQSPGKAIVLPPASALALAAVAASALAKSLTLKFFM